ncbi:DHA1 family bicyclomycin/chloramphenicol resistance-like MFS transporter [Variovorax boronicumulans]|uniref:multidrug effflux MFS transporter n=1 Tax=Variovorax boronicumulans TaxID=436515 RepID=UPI002474F2D2|nr:multidrug effflux MFS transporter [Variovorax boronicumulans]MDH6171005.1 DHA1 family bicyclomycin/chloramphenicol resistance-like MFS transporter [Variovorax boronicumulans]
MKDAAVQTLAAGRPVPTRGMVSLLAALAAIGALSTNIILPSFPAIGAGLGVSDAQLGVTLSIFFVVFAIGQLIVGPLSDRYGRRKLVIGGLLIFAAGGVICALSPNLTWLVLGRAAQAAGVCAASVLARAIARDLFEGETLSKVLAMVIVAMAAAPGFSPLLGSVAEQFVGWRWTFATVSAMGLILAIWYALRLPETHTTSRRTPLAIGPVFAAYIQLLRDARFMRPATVVACVTGALYGFFAAAPAVLIGALGLSSLQLGFFFAATVPVVFAAGLLVPKLSGRWGPQKTLQLGLVLSLTGGMLICGVNVQAPTNLVRFTAALCVFLFGMGMANPLGTALSLAPFAAQAGAASAMLGFMQMSGAALGATFVTKLAGLSPMAALGLVVVASQVLSIALFALLRQQPPKPYAR